MITGIDNFGSRYTLVIIIIIFSLPMQTWLSLLGNNKQRRHLFALPLSIKTSNITYYRTCLTLINYNIKLELFYLNFYYISSDIVYFLLSLRAIEQFDP